MDTVGRILHLVILSSVLVNAVPPDACFTNFRWDDCGKPPTPVMYYWKPGARCEVGIWRGCLPNPNMFSDEYACINTCIFVARGSNMDALDVPKYDEAETDSVELVNVTEIVNVTDIVNVTESILSVTDTVNANDTNTNSTDTINVGNATSSNTTTA